MSARTENLAFTLTGCALGFGLAMLTGYMGERDEAAISAPKQATITTHAEVARLRAQVADAQSWACAQVKPEYSRNPREYRWCSRERNSR